MTGKLSGTVFQKGKYGFIMRSKVSPLKHPLNKAGASFTNAEYWSSQRKNWLIYVTNSWKSLTPAQRQSWEDVKQEGLSGYALYVKRNGRMLHAADVTKSFIPIPHRVITLIPRGTYYNSATQRWVARVRVLSDNPSQYQLRFYGSSPQSPGRKKGHGYSLSHAYTALAGTNDYILYQTGEDPPEAGGASALVRPFDTVNNYLFDPLLIAYKGSI